MSHIDELMKYEATVTMLRRSVAYGMSVLDRYAGKDWVFNVNLETLDQFNTQCCVFSQIFGDEFQAADEHWNRAPIDGWQYAELRWDLDRHECGMELPYPWPGECMRLADELGHALLTALWVERIVQRRVMERAFSRINRPTVNALAMIKTLVDGAEVSYDV